MSLHSLKRSSKLLRWRSPHVAGVRIWNIDGILSIQNMIAVGNVLTPILVSKSKSYKWPFHGRFYVQALDRRRLDMKTLWINLDIATQRNIQIFSHVKFREKRISTSPLLNQCEKTFICKTRAHYSNDNLKAPCFHDHYCRVLPQHSLTLWRRVGYIADRANGLEREGGIFNMMLKNSKAQLNFHLRPRAAQMASPLI